MFAVVKNSQNQFYSIRSAWLKINDENGKYYAFYPAECKMQKYLEKGVEIKSSWKSQEVEVQLDNIEGTTKYCTYFTVQIRLLKLFFFLLLLTDLTEAEDFIQRKIQYVDSEASELDKKMKPKKRKLDTTVSFYEEDFNAEFDRETSYDNFDEQIVPNATPLQESFSKIVSYLYYLAI